MLKKIILPVVILIFTHQEFYGMKGENGESLNDIKNEESLKLSGEFLMLSQQGKWGTINNWVNRDLMKKINQYPKLWWLWAIFDNVSFQYGNNSRIWKRAAAYYGLSNGIGFFLKFKWLKLGIIDTHINVINFILNYFKIYVAKKVYCTSETEKKQINEFSIWVDSFIDCLFVSVVMTGIHLLSFNFFNCVKIKIIAIGAFIVLCMIDDFKDGNRISSAKSKKDNEIEHIVKDQWYFTFCNMTPVREKSFENMSGLYLILSPRIELNISGIINYFNGK